MGGYIAASRPVIAALRATSCGALYHNAMSPIVTRQVSE
jgi:7-keto-8-aminopelargonate synthetase-like enzyme